MQIPTACFTVLEMSNRSQLQYMLPVLPNVNLYFIVFKPNYSFSGEQYGLGE